MVEEDIRCKMVQDNIPFVYFATKGDDASDALALTKTGSSDTRVRFNQLFNQWWEETCVFSGRSFYITNPNFREMLKMGSSILPFIKDKMQSEPQYKQRALKWLFDAVVAL